MHLEVISFSATAPSTGAAATAVTGDSLTIRNAKQSSFIKVIALWSTKQVAGFLQVAFPSGHDTTRGYRAGDAIGVNPFLLPLGATLQPKAQELMSITIAGSAVGGDVEQGSALLLYEDMPGLDARLMDAAGVLGKIEKLTTIEASIASTAGPGYSGEEAINADSDLLIANRDYAVLGMSSRTQVHAITLRGPDTSNVRVACPGILRNEVTTPWFLLMSRASGERTIPVFNSGNKSSTFIGVATDENAGTFLVTLYLALLK